MVCCWTHHMRRMLLFIELIRWNAAARSRIAEGADDCERQCLTLPVRAMTCAWQPRLSGGSRFLSYSSSRNGGGPARGNPLRSLGEKLYYGWSAANAKESGSCADRVKGQIRPVNAHFDPHCSRTEQGESRQREEWARSRCRCQARGRVFRTRQMFRSPYGWSLYRRHLAHTNSTFNWRSTRAQPEQTSA